MKRGEIWTIRGSGYASKPRPVVIVQANLRSGDSVILCLLTSVDTPEAGYRLPIKANRKTGLKKNSIVMAEKLLTVRKSDLGERIGSLTDAEMSQLSGLLARVLLITPEDLA